MESGFRTVRTRLSWLVFGPLVAIVLFGGLGLWSFLQNLIRQDRAAFQQEILLLQEEFIDRYFDERRADMARLAAALERSFGDTEAMRAEIERFRDSESEFTSANFRGPDGITDISGQADERVDVSDRSYFEEALRGNAATSGVLLGRATGNPIVIIAHPVRNRDEQVDGVVFGGVSVRTVASLIEACPRLPRLRKLHTHARRHHDYPLEVRATPAGARCAGGRVTHVPRRGLGDLPPRVESATE